METEKARSRGKEREKARGRDKVICEIEGCSKVAIIFPNGAKLCPQHKAEDDNTRGRVSLKALGFKMDWKRAQKSYQGSNITKEKKKTQLQAMAQLRACSSTLSVMQLLACRPKQHGEDYKIFGLIDDSRSINQTPYLLLDTCRYFSSKECVPLMQMLIEYMGVKPPLMVVSITGADFDNTIDLKVKIKAIIDSAVTEMTNVWFITTGMGSGVSAMVGRAVADFRKMLPGRNEGMMPVIGIIPWSEVPSSKRAMLGENLVENDVTAHSLGYKSPRRVEYTANSTAQWPDLDDCHTHYFFVRDGSEDHQTLKKSQNERIVDDQQAANRFTKDFEDAIKEEVKYMVHLRKWRRRYVNASTHFATYKVVNTASSPEKQTNNEIILNGTIFPTGYAMGVNFEVDIAKKPRNPSKVIKWKSKQNMGPAYEALEVQWIEFIVQDVYSGDTKSGNNGANHIKEIVVRHVLESNLNSVPPVDAKVQLVLDERKRTRNANEALTGALRFEDSKKEIQSLEVYRSGSVFSRDTSQSLDSTNSRSRTKSILSLLSLDNNDVQLKAELDDVNEFDHFLEHTTKVGAVKLVISGGPECLEAAEFAVRDVDALCPLVVFKGSGGFADVVSLAWDILHSRDPLAAQLQREQLDSMVRKVFDVKHKTNSAAFLSRIYNVCAVQNKVLLFDVANSAVNDLDKYILNAIINVARPDFEAFPDFDQINTIDAIGNTDVDQDTWNDPKDWVSPAGQERKAEMVQNYELHLNALRFAMEVDRIDEMSSQLDAARKNYELMEKIFREVSEVARRNCDQKIDNDYDFDEGMAIFWWGVEESSNRLILTFNEQVELALEWALDENRLEQVKLLKPMVHDFPRFVYGKKRCRPEEGYGTTLAELYEYESHREVMQYLEPLLEFLKNEPKWNGIAKMGVKDGEPENNIEKINNVRIRRVWSLVLQLLYDDEDKEAPLDESYPGWHFEADDVEDCKHRWGPLKCDSDGLPEGIPINFHIDRTLRSVFNLVMQSSKDGSSAGSLLANQELMIWAVLFNRFELAEYFWQEGGCAIPNALLASRLLFGLANKDRLQQGSLSHVIEKMNKMSEHFEQAAIGVLTVCYAENSDLAQDVLLTDLRTFDWMGYGVRGQKMKFMNSLQLAFLADNMNFIAHPACQAVVDREWRGGRNHTEKRSIDGKLLEEKSCVIPDMVPLVGGIELSRKLFYNKMISPSYKFRMDALQYACVLLLQSYCVLQNLKVDEPKDMFIEHILAVWYLAMICEEIRSMFDDGWGKVFFNRWLEDAWNKLDIAMYVLFFITYGIRLTFAMQRSNPSKQHDPKYSPYRMYAINSSHGVGGKGMYGLICLIMYIRAFQYLSNDEGLGPKILVLGELTTSLMQYLVLLALFIVAFGIFMEALSNPSFSLNNNPNGRWGGERDSLLGNQDWSRTLHNVLYRPYFQMYGELMLEDISSETRCLGHTPFTGCSTGFEAIAIPIAISIYMIVTSLMILNMLIADFTLTFEASLETASRTFKMNKYNLLQQYDSKPCWPVPLSLLYSLPARLITNLPTIFSILKGFCCGCCNCITVNADVRSIPTADEIEVATIVEDFQDRCCDTYLLEVKRKKHENVDCRVARIEAEMIKTSNALQFFKGKWFTNFARRDLQVVDERPKNADYPQYTVESTLEALNRETARVLMPTDEVENSEARRKAIATQVEKSDKNALIIRGAKDGKWAPGALEGLRCSFFQEVARNAELEAITKRDGDEEDFPMCRYRKQHTQRKQGGKPESGNPFGNPFLPGEEREKISAYDRFGSTTLGSFPNQSGENKMFLHIVTRWKRDENGMTIDRGGRKLMEFVAFKRDRKDDMWSIPAIPEDQRRPWKNTSASSSDSTNWTPPSAQVARTHFDSAVNQFAFTTKNFKDTVTETQKKYVQEQVDQLFYVPHTGTQPNMKGIKRKQETYPFNGKTIFQGFMDDERATASAWLTVEVVIHHDERGFLDAYDLSTSRATKLMYKDNKNEEFGFGDDEPTAPPAEIAWLTLHKDLDLFGEEEDLLHHVASLHGAYW